MKSESIVDRINCFVKHLPSQVYDRPAEKFVRDFLSGMIASQSTVLTNIARSLSKGAGDFKAVYKRINRRLGEVDFSPAYEQQRIRAFKEITDDTVIAIDLGDITKPYSTVLECLGQVADGSDGHRIKPGYWLLGAVAVNPYMQEKTPDPLELKIFSSSSETFSSENTVLKELISDIHAHSRGRGTHVIDRGGDRGVILKHYVDLSQKFIIRLKDRNLEGQDGVVFRVGKMRQIHRDNLKYGASLKRESDIHDRPRQTMNIRFDYERVKVRRVTKDPKKEFHLVTAWSTEAKRPIELLTSGPVRNSDDALNVILKYLARWSVEETYRFLKAGAGLEEMRLFSFDKLCNLTRACFISASLIARMTKHSSWRRLFARTALRLKRPPEQLYNWLYRAADACAVLLNKHMCLIRQENRPIFHARKPSGLVQLSLFPDDFDL